MYLKSLELTGFKSFAKKTLLTFGSPISSIVGPNGSGKSNTAEAFRFVLGEQSIKSMRGKRTEDLIFNGTKELPRANRASVKVVFDNSRRLLNIDFDEVSIERVIHRDSSSEYFINGSQVRLKDIIELLAQAHIGSSGHHIISQGEADRVLSANLKERREMIEDALGLKIYQYKKQESVRKLEKTNENISQVESLRKEIAPHLKFLKKQMEKVEKAMEMKKDLSDKYREYLKREDIYLKLTKSQIENDKRDPLELKSKLERELIEAKAVLAKSSGRDEKSDELIRLEGKLASFRREKDVISRELGRLEGIISYEERRYESEKKMLESIGSEPVPIKDIEILSSEIEEKINKTQSSEDVFVIKTVLIEIGDRIRNFLLERKIKSDISRLDSIKSEIEKKGVEKNEAENKEKNLEQEEENLNKEISVLKQDIEREKDSNRDAEKAVFRIMAEENNVNNILQNIRIREEKWNVEKNDFDREIQEGIMLVGREISLYHDFFINESEIINENRVEQESRRKIIEKIKIRLEDSVGGNVDDIVKEHKEVSERDEFLTRELIDLEKSAESLEMLIKDLELRLDGEFRDGIKKINMQFQEFFSLMFGGGNASLEVIKQEKKKKMSDEDLSGILENNMSVPEEIGETEDGIDIHVSLPNKKTKGLVMLSGGERALTSIALIFAMSQVNPPPFIILDETDAALDEANSRKYGDMIENLSKHSQLILITHNRETMSRAGILYGVTMGNGGDSKILSIAFDEAVEVAK